MVYTMWSLAYVHCTVLMSQQEEVMEIPKEMQVGLASNIAGISRDIESVVTKIRKAEGRIDNLEEKDNLSPRYRLYTIGAGLTILAIQLPLH